MRSKFLMNALNDAISIEWKFRESKLSTLFKVSQFQGKIKY